MAYPFSEIMVGDKFIFEDEDEGSAVIKIKTGPDTCRVTDLAYAGSGNVPESTGNPEKEVKVPSSTPVVKLLDLAEMVMQIQHEIWEASVEEGESYSEILDRVIENTAEYEDQEIELVHKVARMIRDARESQGEES